LSGHGLARGIGWAAVGLLAAGCVTAQPYDYTNYRLHPPRSIVVLPPLNQSTAVEATYGYLTTVTRPLAERGYYVFPIAVVDQFLKENGLPGAGEMHQVPVEKLAEILGADAVLFVTVEQYGTKYLLIDSVTTVAARGRLVDTRTGLLLWEGRRVLQHSSSSGQSNLVAMVVTAAISQVVNTTTDAAHGLSPQLNVLLFHQKDRGLLYGPYHPRYNQPPE
jgi:hypothetical protein